MSKIFNSRNLWRELKLALLIFLLAAAVGLAVNSQMLWRVLSGHSLNTVPVSVDGPVDMILPLPVELAEVRELQGSTTLLIDARSREAFAEGHLPGARSLPRAEAVSGVGALLAEVPLSTPLIVYCSGYDCHDSFELAEGLIAAGYRQVRIYEGGFPEWRDAGLPLEGAQP
jgi:rhodanese-related sulfurtransferase